MFPLSSRWGSCDPARRVPRASLPGILDAPTVEVLSYKVFVTGRAGVGKTTAITRLAGLASSSSLPSSSPHGSPHRDSSSWGGGAGYHETPGIQTTVVDWPVRLPGSEKPLLFRLHLWESGDAALRRFHHILPACTEAVDAVLLLFSLTDRVSLQHVEQQLARGDGGGRPQGVAHAVLATKCDQMCHSDVSEQELAEVHRSWRVPLFRMGVAGSALRDPAASVVAEAQEIRILDGLTQLLWERDRAVATLAPPP